MFKTCITLQNSLFIYRRYSLYLSYQTKYFLFSAFASRISFMHRSLLRFAINYWWRISRDPFFLHPRTCLCVAGIRGKKFILFYPSCSREELRPPIFHSGKFLTGHFTSSGENFCSFRRGRFALGTDATIPSRLPAIGHVSFLLHRIHWQKFWISFALHFACAVHFATLGVVTLPELS